MQATPTRLNPKTYPIAPHGVFWSIQGEAHLRGFQMAFLRLAGCDVGCAECDTDYSVDRRLSISQIVEEMRSIAPKGCKDRWAWITGGEPMIHHMRPLHSALRDDGWSIAVASSGKHRMIEPVDWISISYHGGYPLRQAYGNEIKLVEGLNGLDLDHFLEQYPDSSTDFLYRYVQPLWDPKLNDECPKSLSRCLAFLKKHPNWSLSRQDHKFWDMA
jgi:7-carboxy-7-deazaguanine synthase